MMFHWFAHCNFPSKEDLEDVGQEEDLHEEKTDPAIRIKRLSDKTVAVNDHVCPVCKEDRVSKSENTCWRCGSDLHPEVK